MKTVQRQRITLSRYKKTSIQLNFAISILCSMSFNAAMSNQDKRTDPSTANNPIINLNLDA